MNKKLMIAGLSFIMMVAFTVKASAQYGGGGGGDRQARMKQMLKDSVGLNDTQIDSVTAIQQEQRPQMRDIFQDQSLSQDDKMTKLKALQDAAAARYAKFMTPDQIAKLQAMQQRMRARMGNRGGGGGNGGGGNGGGGNQ